MATVRNKTPLRIGGTVHDPVEFEGFKVLPSRGGVEIEGLDINDAKMALKLLGSAKRIQVKYGRESAARLIDIMDGADVELTPPAPVEQARRLADHRRKLLGTATYTMNTLGELQGKKSASAVRTWVSRKRERRQLFTVTVDRRVLIPAFQLNDDGTPRTDLAPILKTLLDGDVVGWALWTWLTGGTPLLSGGAPEEVAATNPERALRAASRFAAQNRPAI